MKIQNQNTVEIERPEKVNSFVRLIAIIILLVLVIGSEIFICNNFINTTKGLSSIIFGITLVLILMKFYLSELDWIVNWSKR
jgi:hypothetical protein